MIKPIETVYNGYRFRSRLEARWAVFFDALGIEYEYEKEGFDLGKYGWYLPDFYLPEQNFWVEIKPNTYGNLENLWVDHPVFDAWRDNDDGRFSFNESPLGGLFIVVVGSPWPKPTEARFSNDTTRYSPGEMEYVVCVPWDFDWYWCQCPTCKSVRVQYCGRYERNCYCNGDGDHGGIMTTELLLAYQAAQQARFEHGESPLVNLKS